MKLMKLAKILICLMILGVPHLSAQTPMLSDIGVDTNGAEVVLTWKDSDEIENERYRVLRYYKSITEQNYSKAMVLGDVSPNVESFVDTPPSGRKWWYAVMLVTDSRMYANFQDWRNVFPLPVQVESSDDFRDGIAKILDIKVEQRISQLELEYSTDKTDREIIVFRSIKFIDNPKILDYTTIIGRTTGKTGRLTDKPMPGIPYYYAAVDAELFESAYSQILDFIKLTRPIIPTYDENDESKTYRPTPLPEIRLSGMRQDGKFIPDITGDLPQRRHLGTEAEHTIRSMIKSIKTKPVEEPTPQVMEIDRAPSNNRRQQALQAILKGLFAEEDWKNAEMELFALSASNGLNPETKSRILYYQGQALYFLGHYQDALATFTISSKVYYTKSQRWIQAIYNKLKPIS